MACLHLRFLSLRDEGVLESLITSLKWRWNQDWDFTVAAPALCLPRKTCPCLSACGLWEPGLVLSIGWLCKGKQSLQQNSDSSPQESSANFSVKKGQAMQGLSEVRNKKTSNAHFPCLLRLHLTFAAWEQSPRESPLCSTSIWFSRPSSIPWISGIKLESTFFFSSPLWLWNMKDSHSWSF